MKFEYSYHWKEQKQIRKEITDDIIEYCIQNSQKLKDRKWKNAYNSIGRIPPSGRLLKVVFREEGKTIKILTSYWLD